MLHQKKVQLVKFLLGGKIMRTYLLTYDNGRDYLQMEFSSDFRLNSKGNKADAEKAMQKRSRYSTIVAIERIN